MVGQHPVLFLLIPKLLLMGAAFLLGNDPEGAGEAEAATRTNYTSSQILAVNPLVCTSFVVVILILNCGWDFLIAFLIIDSF